MNEISEIDKKFQKELNSGTTALVLLGIIKEASAPMYGYQIAKSIESSCENTPIMKQGALYPVLRALENGGLLDSEVEPSVSGPPRRYYKITDTGRVTLETWRGIWGRTKALVDVILQGGN
ncbi:PadR family transcriptional regulator [Chloroflexota bacterium]